MNLFNTPIQYQNTDESLADPEWKKLAYGISQMVNNNQYIVVLGKNKTNPKFFVALKKRISDTRFCVATVAFDDMVECSDDLIRYSSQYLLESISNTLHKQN